MFPIIDSNKNHKLTKNEPKNKTDRTTKERTPV